MDLERDFSRALRARPVEVFTDGRDRLRTAGFGFLDAWVRFIINLSCSC